MNLKGSFSMGKSQTLCLAIFTLLSLSQYGKGLAWDFPAETSLLVNK